jgi:hypothetical protein
MNAGLSVLVPLLAMFFALSMERVESRLCARRIPDDGEELLVRRVPAVPGSSLRDNPTARHHRDPSQHVPISFATTPSATTRT